MSLRACLIVGDGSNGILIKIYPIRRDIASGERIHVVFKLENPKEDLSSSVVYKVASNKLNSKSAAYTYSIDTDLTSADTTINFFASG